MQFWFYIYTIYSMEYTIIFLFPFKISLLKRVFPLQYYLRRYANMLYSRCNKEFKGYFFPEYFRNVPLKWYFPKLVYYTYIFKKFTLVLIVIFTSMLIRYIPENRYLLCVAPKNLLYYYFILRYHPLYPYAQNISLPLDITDDLI